MLFGSQVKQWRLEAEAEAEARAMLNSNRKGNEEQCLQNNTLALGLGRKGEHIQHYAHYGTLSCVRALSTFNNG